MSELIWVAVPGGRVIDGPPDVGKLAVLRALIVPRLDGDSSSGLAAYGLENWPQTLAEGTLQVLLRSDAAATAKPATDVVVRDQANPDAWHALFDGMAIRVFSRLPAYDVPAVTRTAKQAGTIHTAYQATAQELLSAPDTGAGRPMFEQRLAPFHPPDDDPPAGGREGRRSAQPRDAGREHGEPVADFHRTVAMLREHPAVLRALGLIVEVTFPAAQLADYRQVQVQWAGSPRVPPARAFWTHYEFGDGQFWPLSTTNVTRGMVDLTGAPPAGSADNNDLARWVVGTVDVDLGMKRLGEAARAQAAAPAAQPQAAVLPPLRSAGLMLMRRNRVDDLIARREVALRFEQPDMIDKLGLDADDLTLGYRIDVGTDDGTWRSLCKRRATYELRGAERMVPVGPPGTPEEGHVKANAISRNDDGALEADEVVARWSGWSLVVPQPTFDGHEPHRAAAGEQRLHFDFAAEEQTLPKLRFGRTYQLRARVADVTGGGLELDDSIADRCATSQILYTRHEPLPPPHMHVPDAALHNPGVWGPGGQADALVVRSDPAGTTTFIDDPARYPPNDRRVFLPPSAPLAIVEHHGKLDGADVRTWQWVQRAMALAEDVPEALAGEDPVLTGLPDPAATRMVIHLPREPELPDTPITDRRPWTGAWPELVVKALQLNKRSAQGAEALIEGDAADPILIHLAPAEQAVVELSSSIADAERSAFAITGWVGATHAAAAADGRHPMATPPVLLKLVHAVRRPLTTPDGTLIPLDRAVGQTYAELEADLTVDTASTVQLDVNATWSEWDDRALDVGPPSKPRTPKELAPRTVSDLVKSVTVDRGELALPTFRHEFGDTRHREVSYWATAVSRFRQYFDEHESAESFLATGTPRTVTVPSSARPPVPIVLSTVPAFEWYDPGDPLDDPGADFSFELARIPRLRVELARPWFVTGEAEQLAVIVSADRNAPRELWPFLTQVGRDPIWDTPAPDRWPTPAVSFTPWKHRVHQLHEAGESVALFAFDVWSHDGRVFADIYLEQLAGLSYCPFVQLALARYQAHSVEQHELSAVVRSETVALPPDRLLSVERRGQDLHVRLEGVGPSSGAGDPRSNRVRVYLETARPNTARSVDLIALDPRTGAAPGWFRPSGWSVSGRLEEDLPILRIPSVDVAGEDWIEPESLRLHVRETEYFDPNPGEAGGELAERTVYVHTMTIP